MIARTNRLEGNRNMIWLMFHWATAALLVVLQIIGIGVGIHALLHKKDPRAALGWAAICVGVPAIGVILYLIFGVNRISLVAKQWESRGRWRIIHKEGHAKQNELATSVKSDKLKVVANLKKTGSKVCDYPLVTKNHIEVMYDGCEAYPAMQAAIDQATESIYLSTYIFSSKSVGNDFIKAITESHQRGVDVKVLIDGVGALYAMPSVYRKFKKRGIPVTLFLRPFKSWYHTLHLNLRNHRKLLIVDGRMAFTGGMNIRQQHINTKKSGRPKIRDIHFLVKGEIVGQLQDVFLRDWHFNTGESPKEIVYHDNSPQGNAILRAIASGPQQMYDQLQCMLCAALVSAKSSIKIMTPYFVPDQTLISALNTAALRGIKIDIILPQKNNIFYIKGASEALMPQLLQHGVNFYYRPNEFSHIKLFLMDKNCAFTGSSNFDARSLHLNFELDLEIYDAKICKELNHYFDGIKAISKSITKEMLLSRPLLIKVLNSFYKLFSPYL